MIRRILFSLLAVMFLTNLSAQSFYSADDDDISVIPVTVNKSYNISLGIKAGINYSLVSDPAGYNLGMSGNIGYQGGLAANMHFGRRHSSSPGGTGWFGIQIEALYSQKSIKTDSDNINLSGFEIPILIQCYLSPSLCIEAGPTFTGNFSCSPGNIRYNNNVIYSEDFKANDVMFTLGIGYKNKKGFNLSARYNLGNSNMAENFETKLSTIEVSIGWLFSLIK